MLTGLIEAQGDPDGGGRPGNAILEPEALIVFVTAARRARRHGGRFILKDPPTEAQEALQSGSAGWVEVLPRQASG